MRMEHSTEQKKKTARKSQQVSHTMKMKLAKENDCKGCRTTKRKSQKEMPTN